MDVIELLPRLRFLRFPVGHAYLWRDPDGLTLVDTGLPGSASLIADAIRQGGDEPADLRRVVLTHFHPDHVGTTSASATGPSRSPSPGTCPAAWRSTCPPTRSLFTGDAAASGRDGTVIGGVFNVDRAQTAASLAKLARLSVSLACFGHGEPFAGDATAALAAAVRSFTP